MSYLPAGTWWETLEEFRARRRRVHRAEQEPEIPHGACSACGKEIVDTGKLWYHPMSYAALLSASAPVYDVCSFRCALEIVEKLDSK